MGFDLPGKSDVFGGCRSWNSASLSAVKRRRFRSSLKRSYALPTMGMGDHETEIIDHDLSREPAIAFVAIDIFRCACVALGKGLLKFKLRELDPSGGDRLALADTEVKSPDGQSGGCSRSERSTSRQRLTSATSCPEQHHRPLFSTLRLSVFVSFPMVRST
jgi:hypothetical protein